MIQEILEYVQKIIRKSIFDEGTLMMRFFSILLLFCSPLLLL